MNTLMQREDFLALCKPVRRFANRPVADACRVIRDWFPKGSEFLFNGIPYRSFGPVAAELNGRYQAVLEAECLFTSTDPELPNVVLLTARCALSLAQQNSVDHINALNFFEQ